MVDPVTRRTVVAGMVAGLGGGLAPALAQQTAARFGGIRVNAAPLAARGGGASARLIQTIMPAKMQGVFADLVSPDVRGAPLLVARIDTVFLPGYGDSREGNLYALQRDTMSGAGLIVAGRAVQATTPLSVNLPPAYSGSWYLPDIDARRVDSLCYQFAYWLRREMRL